MDSFYVIIGGFAAWIAICGIVAAVARRDAREQREKADRIRERHDRRMAAAGAETPSYAARQEREYAKRRAAVSLKANPPAAPRSTSYTGQDRRQQSASTAPAADDYLTNPAHPLNPASQALYSTPAPSSTDSDCNTRWSSGYGSSPSYSSGCSASDYSSSDSGSSSCSSSCD